MGLSHSREAEGAPELQSLEAKRIVLTPAFMRLESLKQLGCARWVFPAGNHCRDEHSIAVACKARRVGEHLGATDSDLILLEVAGLCHDLGHGPFSHVWEHAILPRLGVQDWHHEVMSAKLLRHINTRHNIGLTDEQLARITDIINGKNTSGLDWSGREWLLQVVASMVDVDRLDYLVRDARNSRFNLPHDFSQLLQGCQVLPDESGRLQVCFHESQQPLLEAMFSTRYQLHTCVYQHPTVKSVELMVADVVAAADGVMQFSQLAHEPEDFIALTDGIIDEIRCRLRLITKGQGQQLQQSQQQLDDLTQAAALLERIDMRQFFPCAAELTPYDERFKSVSAASLAEVCGGLVAPGDIRLVPVSLDHGRKDQDPLEAVTLHDARGTTFKGRFRQPPAGGFMTSKLRLYLTRDFGADTDAQAQAIQALQAGLQQLVQQLCAGTDCSGVSITHPCSQPDAAADAAVELEGASSNGQGSPESLSAGTQVPLLLTPAAVAHRSLTALQLSQDSMQCEDAGGQQTQTQLQELPFQGCYQLRRPSRKRPRGGSFRQQQEPLSDAQQALLLGEEEEGDDERLPLMLSQADSLGS